MAKWKKLAHVVYQCSYHIVWTPKYRYRILEGEIAKIVEEKIRSVCEWKGAEILELNVMKDHVHMVVSVPPRVSISELMGILKGNRHSYANSIGVVKQKLNHIKSPNNSINPTGITSGAFRSSPWPAGYLCVRQNKIWRDS